MAGEKDIIVTGCYRSGTTALYNLVRLMLKHAGVDYCAYFWNEKRERTAEYSLIKTHAFSPTFAKSAWKVLVAHRPLSDIRQSMEDVRDRQIAEEYGSAGDVDNARKAYANSLKWLPRAGYVQNYTFMKETPGRIVEDLQRVLYLSVQVDAVVSEFLSLRAPGKGHDPETLLSEAHWRQQG